MEPNVVYMRDSLVMAMGEANFKAELKRAGAFCETESQSIQLINDLWMQRQSWLEVRVLSHSPDPLKEDIKKMIGRTSMIPRLHLMNFLPFSAGKETDFKKIRTLVQIGRFLANGLSCHYSKEWKEGFFGCHRFFIHTTGKVPEIIVGLERISKGEGRTATRGIDLISNKAVEILSIESTKIKPGEIDSLPFLKTDTTAYAASPEGGYIKTKTAKGGEKFILFRQMKVTQ